MERFTTISAMVLTSHFRLHAAVALVAIADASIVKVYAQQYQTLWGQCMFWALVYLTSKCLLLLSRWWSSLYRTD